VDRPKRRVVRAPSNGVGRARIVMPHGGSDERFVCEPVPPGPEAHFTFGRGPVVASRRRLAAELTSSLPKLARRSAPSVGSGASAVCLHNQNACTSHIATHSAGQDTPLPGGVETGAITSLSPATLADGKPPARNRTERLRTFNRSRTRRRSLPLPRLVLSPRTGRDLEKTMRVMREAPLLAERDPGYGMSQRQRTLAVVFGVGAHLRRHVRPSNRSRDGPSRHDPSPMKSHDCSSQDHP